MLAHSVVAAVSDRRRRSEIDATIRARRERRYGQCAGTYVVLYSSAFVHKDQTGRALGRQLLMPARPFFGDVGPFLFGGGQSFLNSQPSRRSQGSTVEVGKARSIRASNSARVASGCSDNSSCSLCFRSSVSSVLRPHQCVWAASVRRSRNCWRTRRTTAMQKPKTARSLACSFAALVELEDALPDRNRNGSHEHPWPHNSTVRKPHYLCKCSSQ